MGFFLFGYIQESFSEVGVRHPVRMLLKLGNVFGFLHVLIAQELNEALAVLRRCRTEKSPPACGECARKFHQVTSC